MRDVITDPHQRKHLPALFGAMKGQMGGGSEQFLRDKHEAMTEAMTAADRAEQVFDLIASECVDAACRAHIESAILAAEDAAWNAAVEACANVLEREPPYGYDDYNSGDIAAAIRDLARPVKE